MPLPFIVGGVIAAAGAAGIGAGVHGAIKTKDAKDTMRWAEEIVSESKTKFEKSERIAKSSLEKIEKKELEILNSFNTFADVFEHIKGRPEFKEYRRDGVELPKINFSQLKEVSINASIVLASTTSSTVTAAASSLLSSLPIGTIGITGGGIGLASAGLGVTTLGASLLISGVIMGVTGKKLSEKADEAFSQACDIEREVKKICEYLSDLNKTSTKFLNTLNKVDKVYLNHLDKLKEIVMTNKKTDWEDFTDEEKLITENTTYLVQLLFTMCKTKLALQDETKDGINEVNSEEIKKRISDAGVLLAAIENV